ncbi:hypothetical protein GOBAR_AA02900 [Gossypium barbadense]|uniref:RNase H type-1 domain-containing protein n=1 Tax=Gossypium barbadense TaxID=3634 RepID=A0A2P5YPZ8_GOSBA|nr:hypothetical protein GOBAR_AA02900 [Gossypium barbadense]
MNNDGAFSCTSGAAIGVVMRNDRAELIAGVAKKIDVDSAEEAEAIAGLVGVQIGSCYLLFNLLRIMVESWKRFCLEKVKREANKASDWTAGQAQKRMRMGDLVRAPPFSLMKVLRGDVMRGVVELMDFDSLYLDKKSKDIEHKDSGGGPKSDETPKPVPGMNGAVEIPRSESVTVFEFGSVAATADKVTLAGFCPVSDKLEPCRWEILSAKGSDAPQFRVVF